MVFNPLHNTFLFNIAAVVVLLLLLVLYGIALHPHQDTSRWNICHNGKAGYELRYPADLYSYGEDSLLGGGTPPILGLLSATSSCSGSTIWLSNIPPHHYGQPDYSMSSKQLFRIWVERDDGWGWWGQALSKGVAQTFKPETIIQSKALKTVLLDGVSFQVFSRPKGYPEDIVILGFHNGYVYMLTASDSLAPEPLETMLSTLKFIVPSVKS